jgi:hypothetical protein
MEKVIRDGHVAVIISNGYGAGWSTWHYGPNRETLVFHPKLVELIESGQCNQDNMLALLTELIGEIETVHVYLGGVEDLTIEWLPEGTRFKIEEYDGSEHIITERSFDMTA